MIRLSVMLIVGNDVVLGGCLQESCSFKLKCSMLACFQQNGEVSETRTHRGKKQNRGNGEKEQNTERGLSDRVIKVFH